MSIMIYPNDDLGSYLVYPDMLSMPMNFTTVIIPDHLPELVRGTREDPSKGGCLMQVTNYLARRTWTDQPSHNVLPILQNIAVKVNDLVCDMHRQQLWRFVPRLMETFNLSVPPSIAHRLMMDPAFAGVFQHGSMPCRTCKERCVVEQCCPHCKVCEMMIDLLSRAIDEVDHFSKRKNKVVQDIPWERLSPENVRLQRERRDRLACESMKAAAAAFTVSVEQALVTVTEAVINMGNMAGKVKMYLETSPYVFTTVDESHLLLTTAAEDLVSCDA